MMACFTEKCNIVDKIHNQETPKSAQHIATQPMSLQLIHQPHENAEVEHFYSFWAMVR